MNVFAKRALILTVLVLCLFGLTIFGVSAATGAAESGENSVASAVVGGTTLYYDDLATALAEADTGSTVTVLKDVALASTVVIDRADATLTLDLGGKTVTTADGVSLAIRLTAGTVTIKNGTIAATSDAIYMGTKALETDPTVVLTLASDLTVTSVTDCCVVVYAGTLNTAATLTTDSVVYCAVQGSGNNNGTVINITGGTITGANVALYHPQNGTLNISGGTITGETGVYVKAGTVNITGGKIVATGAAAAYAENKNGCVSTGDALVVENPGADYGGVAPVVSVTGGEFSSENGTCVASYAVAEQTAVTGIVSGGTFDTALSEDVCAEGFVVEDVDGDGSFVTNPANAVAYIGDVGFATLAEAVAAAQDGDTVKLVADVTTDSIIKLENAITIDGGTHTISTSAAKKVFEVYADATIKNVTITNTYSGGRCVDTRVAGITVNLNNVTLQATNGSSQPLTIGGSDLAGLTVNVTDSTIAAGNSGYAVISFVKANLTVTNSQLSGYGVIYFQDQTWDDTVTEIASVITLTDSTLTSTNVHSGESNAFGAIVLQEVSGATLSLINTDVVATATGDQPQVAIDFDNNPVTVTIDKDSTVTADAGDEIIGGLDIATATVTVAPENTALIAALKEEGFTISSTGSIVTPVAMIGETGYATLAEAVAAAQDGDTIKLVANVTTGTITVNKSITIEGVAIGDVYPSICYTANKVFSLANTTLTFNLKNVSIAGDENSPNSNFIYISAGAVATIDINNVAFTAGEESTASGIIYSANGQVTITAKNFTLNAGAALFNAPNTPAATDYVKITLTDSNLNGKPVVNSAAQCACYFASDATAIASGMVARIGAEGETAKYFTTLKVAVAAAASGDTIYLITNHTVSSAIAFKAKTLTIASANASARVTLTLSPAEAFSIYQGAGVTLKDILIKANGRKFRTYATDPAGAMPVLTFAKGAELTTTSWSNDGVMHCNVASKFVLEEGASWSFSGSSTGAKVPVYMVAGSVLELAGNISYTFAAGDNSTTGVANVANTQVILHPTAKLVNFAPTGANAGRVFVSNSDYAVEFKGFADEAAKTAVAVNFHLIKANNNYYTSLLSAYNAAANNSTITLMGDYRISSSIYPSKTITITGYTADVVLGSIAQIPFVFNTSDTTFTNMKIVLTAAGSKPRFGRIDGSASVTFGDNCHITSTNEEHFLYTNDTMQSGLTVKTWTVTIAETASFKRPTGNGYFMQSSAPAASVGDNSAIHIYGTFDVPASTNSGNIYRDSAKHSDGTTNAGGNPNVSIHIYSTANIVATRGCSTYATALTYYHGMTVDQAMAIVTTGGHHIMGSDGTNFFSVYAYSALTINNFLSKVANNSTVYVRSFNGQKFVITEKTLTFRGWTADGSIPTISGATDQFMLGNNGQVTFENMVYTISGRAFRFGDNNSTTTDNNTKFVLGDNFTIKMNSWGTEDLFHSGGAASTSFEMKATATIDITHTANTTGVHRLFFVPENTTQMDFRGTIKINITSTDAVPAAYFMGVTNMAGTINIYDTAVFEISIAGGQTAYAGATCNHFFRQTNSANKINIYGGTFTLTGAVTLALSNTEAGNMKITGGTFTHNGDGSGEDRDVTSIFYRAAGSDKLYDISGATLIAKGNAYIFEQGYGIGMVKNCTISSERAEIIYNAEGGWGTFVNVKVAPATDANRLVIAEGIPFAGRLGYANDGVVDGVIYAGDGDGFNFGKALTAVADAGLEGPAYLMADMDVATSINLKGGSINLAGNNLGTVDAPIYPTITAAVDLFTLSAGDTIVLTNLNLVLSGNRAFYIPAAMASAADITLNNLNVTGSANLVASANVAMSFNLTIDGGRYVLIDPAATNDKGFLFNDATAAEKESINFIISDAYLQCGIIRSRNTEVLSADLDNVTIDVSPKGIFYPYGAGTWTIEINDSNISTASSSLVYNPDTALVILNAYDSEFTITAPTSLYGSFYYGTATTTYAAKLQSTMNNVKITVGGSAANLIYTNSTVSEIALDWTNVTATCNSQMFQILNAGTKVKHHFKFTGCNFVSTSYTINVQHASEAATKDQVFVEIYDSYLQSKIEVLRFTDLVGAYFKCVDSTFNCTGTMCVASNTNGMPYMDFYGCKIYGGGTNYAVRLYGKKGSYANFYDTYIYGNGTANAPLAGGNAIVYNFYSGWIDTKASQGAFNAISADVEINFYGGTVNVLPSTGAAVAYTTSTGKVNVYGGQFYSNNTASALFYNASPTKDLTVGAYVAQGLSELCVNAGTGLPTAAFDKNGVSTFNAPRMTAGATPVVTANGVGLGFLGTVSAATKAYLETHADVVTPAVEDPDNPENNTPAVYAISYGMLIVNYEAIKNDPEALRYLTHYGMKAYFNESEVPYVIDLNEETVAAMQAEGIDVDFEIVNEDDGCVSVKVTLPAGLSEKYGAIVYARSEVNDGAPVYSYSAFSVAENVRNLEQVLRSAYNDLSATQTEFYANAVTVGEVTMYSHFTVDERAAIAELLGADTDRKALDLYIVAGGSNTVGHAPFGADFADDFYASTNLNNVFVSGAMAQNAQLNLGSGAVKDIIAAKYISAGTAAGLGLGWTSDVLGFEAGLASALAEQYNDENGKYAAIFKYGFEDLAIADLTADGSAIYALFIAALMENVAMYEEQGFDVNIVGLYWAQGEADASEDNVLTTYPAQFNTLIADLKADLAVAELPVAVAELSIYTAAGTTIADNEAFVEMQNALENVTIVEIAELLTENGLYFDPTEVILAGEIAASILYNTTVEEADQIEVPKADPMMQILDADGQPFLNEDGEPVGYRSLAIAIAKLPEGCSIQLTSDITLYAALTVINANGAVVDGNGKTITVKASSGSGMVFESSKIEFQNLNIVHTGTAAGTYAIEIGGRSRVTISGNSNLTAEKTVIRMDGVGSTLILKDATVTSRNEDCAATDALIYTTNSNLMVDGGTLNAAGEAACIYIDAAAPEKLAVNIKAGTFNSNATCFINKSIVAIMVAAPGVIVNAPVAFENAGFGNK